jgi:eukaryotic-like serine/threonine-protein kinase
MEPLLANTRNHEPAIIGRYALYDVIASGGMATVHYGRLLGPVGFSRTVAVKRLHPPFARDPEFVAMFIDEARLAARIRHPNVVQTLDVVALDGELFVVMDYVQGESLSRLMRASRTAGPIPVRIASAILCGALHGLHAAHEATDEKGEPLGLVHRDMSPQNILVDVDGSARVLDFGVAKAAGRVQVTGEGKIKGKLRYMAPEQIAGTVTRQSDVFATAAVLWEVLTGARLFTGDDPRQVIAHILNGDILPPSEHVAHLPPGLDAVVMRGLKRDPRERYATARDMAMDLENTVGLASPTQVGAWVESLAQNALAQRAATIAEIESSSSRVVDVPYLTQSSAQALASDAAPAGETGHDPPAYGLRAPRPANDSIPPVSRWWGFRKGPWLVGGAVVMVACTVLLSVLRRAPELAPVALPASTTLVTRPGAPPAPPPSGAVADPPSAPGAASAASAVVPPLAPDVSAHPRPAVRWPVVVPVKHPTVTTDCTPPYSLDAQGHKQWKDACFREQGP